MADKKQKQIFPPMKKSSIRDSLTMIGGGGKDNPSKKSKITRRPGPYSK